jgi:nucleoside-diphosphate kinase
MQSTLMLVKPDAMLNGHLGDIITRVTLAGFDIARIVGERPNAWFMREFYKEHSGKWFFDQQIDFMCSGEVCALELVKENAVLDLRSLVGETNPADAMPGSLRHDFGDRVNGLPRNAVHASDSEKAAERELALVFCGSPGLRISSPSGEKFFGRLDKPITMLVIAVFDDQPTGMVHADGALVCAYTDINAALKESMGNYLWLCVGEVVGKPTLVPCGVNDVERLKSFWSSSEPWAGRPSIVSGGVRRATSSTVACDTLIPIHRLDI